MNAMTQIGEVRYSAAYPTGRELGEKWGSEGVWSEGVESGGVGEL
jgi:hypothetical protein